MLREISVLLVSKVSLDVQIVFKKAIRILVILKKTLFSRGSSLWRNFYVILVRPHLEYAVQAWNLNLQKDIIEIEKVQIRASKIPNGFCNLSYEERLYRLNIKSLKDRWVSGDQIETYKVVQDLDEIERNKSNGIGR